MELKSASLAILRYRNKKNEINSTQSSVTEEMVVNSKGLIGHLYLRRGRHLENYLETNAEATLQSPIATNS